jgi:hydroxyacylglutathione hydrolase
MSEPSVFFETFPVGLLGCNCTVAGDRSTGQGLVIDPGEEVGRILARLAHHRVRLAQILVTHAHIDHIGGALRLKQETGAPIFFSQHDLPMLDIMDEQAGWLGVATPATAPPDASAEDGMQVGLPTLRAEVLHTPGHTPGSICLHFPGQQILFAGDTLFAGTVGRTDLPGGDARRLLRSIAERLLPLPENTVVVPGHGPSTTLGQERETNPFLLRL